MKQHAFKTLLLICLCFSGQSSASSIISLIPQSDIIRLGVINFVDVHIQPYYGELRGFSMNVYFESGLFQFLPEKSSFGNNLGNISLGEAIGGFTTPTPDEFGGFLIPPPGEGLLSGLLSFYEFSLLDANSLWALQDNDINSKGYNIATLAFYAPGNINPPHPKTVFLAENAWEIDYNGISSQEVIFLGGYTISEPPVILLIGFGLALLGYNNLRRPN